MFVVDTCGWIEWTIDSPLADAYAPYLDNPAQLVVPTLVQLELHKWLCREADEERALSVIAATQEALVVPLDTSLALLAAGATREFRLATADAVIYATARSRRATLVTSDAHFEGLPGVLVIPKGGLPTP